MKKLWVIAILILVLSLAILPGCIEKTDLSVQVAANPEHPSIAFGLDESQAPDLSEYYVNVTKLGLGSIQLQPQVWSSDSRRIYFYYEGWICMSDLETGQISRLARGKFPVISADGKEIFFSLYSRDVDDDISPGRGTIEAFVMNADGSHLRSLGKLSELRMTPLVSLSPDGKKMALTVWTDCHTDESGNSCTVRLGIWDLESGILDTVESFRPFGSEVNWSPDGSKIAVVGFAEGPPNGTDVWIIDTEDNFSLNNISDVSELYPGSVWVPEACPLWSPDGSMIMFSSWNYDKERNPLSNQSFEDIWLAKSDGNERQLLRTKSIKIGGPHCRKAFQYWNHDGSKIAYVEYTPQTEENGLPSEFMQEIWTMDTDGVSRELLLSLPLSEGSVHWLAWSPDGSKIAFEWGQIVGIYPGDAYVYVLEIQ